VHWKPHSFTKPEQPALANLGVNSERLNAYILHQQKLRRTDAGDISVYMQPTLQMLERRLSGTNAYAT
jgi:hypothetical protein